MCIVLSSFFNIIHRSSIFCICNFAYHAITLLCVLHCFLEIIFMPIKMAYTFNKYRPATWLPVNSSHGSTSSSHGQIVIITRTRSSQLHKFIQSNEHELQQ